MRQIISMVEAYDIGSVFGQQCMLQAIDTACSSLRHRTGVVQQCKLEAVGRAAAHAAGAAGHRHGSSVCYKP